MKIKLLFLTAAMAGLSACNQNNDDSDEILITRNDYIGNWNTHEVCTNYSDNYTIYVTAGPVANEIVIDNFHGYGNFSVTAQVSGGTLTINEQGVTGTGTLVDETLTIEFTSQANQCTMTAIR